MKKSRISYSQNLLSMVFVDSALLVVAHIASYLIRFEGQIIPLHWNNIAGLLPAILICKLIVFYSFGLYRGMWRYTSLVDIFNILKASILSTLIILAAILIFKRFYNYSRGVFILDGMLTFFLIAAHRVGIRIYFSHRPLDFLLSKDLELSHVQKDRKRLLIVGAGSVGEKILREFRGNSRLKYHVVGFVDDNPQKLGRYIHGTPVLGSVDEIGDIVEMRKIEEIIIAISSAKPKEMRRIIGFCEGTGVRFRTVPSMGELIDGNVNVKSIRDVSFADLLGREIVHLEEETVRSYLQEKTVLVTGAGGSIGAELCRQIARFSPKHLLLMDRSESPLYEIEMELKDTFPRIESTPILASIQNERHMREVFRIYSPQVVFHAAAYKHVPMLELNPWEAVFNNVVGTQCLLKMCKESNGVTERFVFVSTDKAVRPTNVMGACKRVGELLTQYYDCLNSETKHFSVRFGNVLGSAGSVVPLFMKQIEKRRPVTVTHPEVTRYFMTIPEATQLVLQAGGLNERGAIYVLDMGTPVKIIDMARDLIQLSGLEPDIDIEIKFIGLRPGEKLYEELITQGEGITATEYEKIMVLKDRSLNGEDTGKRFEELESYILELVKLAKSRDTKGIRKKLKEIVPEYTPATD